MNTVKAGQHYWMNHSIEYPDLPEGDVRIIHSGKPDPNAFPHFDWESWEHDGDFVVWEDANGRVNFLPLPDFKRHSNPTEK